MNRSNASSPSSANIDFEITDSRFRGDFAETPPPNAAALLGSPLPPRYRHKLLGNADYKDDGER
ncbi:MAG: hypothetical protein QWI73_07260 [Alphaproteobacteria bacterium]|nr:hypothetical protein [Alphaproteobacteria bacterium]